MSGPLYCVNHPDVETYLRCNRCGRPICAKCAVRTPVGYRCKSCINTHQQTFYASFRPIYYLVAAAVALPLSFVTGILIPLLSWYAIVLGPLAGVGIAELARLAIRRRRGKYTWLVVCGCILIGALPMLVLPPLVAAGFALLSGEIGAALSGLWNLLWGIIYVGMAVGAAYWRLRPGRRV